ncbi:TRAP transporter large permease [Sneathiella litorea]|uniref:TRAP transporter large permease protein n=1 Tax=Sneathiella litorea TaxID=2606216 RepID=A0A6L8WAK9_9PROT|nr:TRAP transporter large permease subunit [Sneathiella litorea]MZR31513.1 TRAP transporter large permease subunit [Sneathiella litorea]
MLLLLLVPTLCLLLFIGIPVPFALMGSALFMSGIGIISGDFPSFYLSYIPDRLFGLMTNEVLVAIPLFIFMGILLEKSRLAEELLEGVGQLFGSIGGGLAIGVTIVGALLAASTGVVGASVVAMGLMSLPIMIKNGYSKRFATGSICAAGTLGQIIPPSILLVLLADQITNANRIAQSSLGNMAPDSVSVLDLFAGALVPGLVLVFLYLLYQLLYGFLFKNQAPPIKSTDPDASRATILVKAIKSMVPPFLLMIAVIGSILLGIATPTEAAAVGALGAGILALIYGRLSREIIQETALGTLRLSGMIFMILLAATVFAIVFRGLGGEEEVHQFLSGMPGGATTALISVMFIVFLLGFIIDFIEITVIVIPLVAPPLFILGVDPVWFAILLAMNLQTSFLTPPFGFSLFYLQSVVPEGVTLKDIYIGIIPFVLIQMFVLGMIAFYPELATWLPEYLNQ